MKKYLYVLVALFLIEVCPISLNRLDANESAKGFFSGQQKRKTMKNSRKKMMQNKPVKKKNNKPINKTIYPF